jgi:hypothetical protein
VTTTSDKASALWTVTVKAPERQEGTGEPWWCRQCGERGEMEQDIQHAEDCGYIRALVRLDQASRHASVRPSAP